MKSKYRYLIVISIILLVFFIGLGAGFLINRKPSLRSAGIKQNKTYVISDWSRSYYSISLPDDYYDFRFLDKKAEIIVGDKKFLDIISKSIPIKTVYDNCGEGLHEFYFIFQIDKNGNVIDCYLRKLSNPRKGGGLTNAEYLIPGKTLINNIGAKYQPGVYNGKNVNSLLTKELVVYVDKNGNSRAGWNYSETLPGISLKLFNYELKNYHGASLERGLEKYKTSPDKMPEYPGGTEAMVKLIEKNIIYPEAAKQAGIEGKVIVEVYIDEIGRITYAKILKGIGGGCEAEAGRVLGLLKNFYPGIENGLPVKTKIVIPFSFHIG